MARDYPSVLDLVGNTPIVRLDRIQPSMEDVFVAMIEQEDRNAA